MDISYILLETTQSAKSNKRASVKQSSEDPTRKGFHGSILIARESYRIAKL
jgi:hypothetical protein